MIGCVCRPFVVVLLRFVGVRIWLASNTLQLPTHAGQALTVRQDLKQWLRASKG